MFSPIALSEIPYLYQMLDVVIFVIHFRRTIVITTTMVVASYPTFILHINEDERFVDKNRSW